MTKIALISDTHGVLKPEVLRRLETCDAILHAGDFDRAFVYERLRTIAPLVAVRGNNDFWADGLPTVVDTRLAGLRIVMAHIRETLPPAAQEADLVVFGHSHAWFEQRRGGALWLNPGSCGRPRFGLPLTMAVLTVEEGAPRVERVQLTS